MVGLEFFMLMPDWVLPLIVVVYMLLSSLQCETSSVWSLPGAGHCSISRPPLSDRTTFLVHLLKPETCILPAQDQNSMRTLDFVLFGPNPGGLDWQSSVTQLREKMFPCLIFLTSPQNWCQCRHDSIERVWSWFANTIDIRALQLWVPYRNPCACLPVNKIMWCQLHPWYCS